MSQFDFNSDSSSQFTIKDHSRNSTPGGDDLPDRLKESDQWLVTHHTPENDNRHKSPKYPSEGWNDGSLLSYIEAHRRLEEEENTALAFRFTEGGPFVGFDLDDVKSDADFTAEALGIVQQLNTYTEISSSGTGLHVIAEGEQLDDHKKRGDLPEVGHLEVYDESRYFVLTGHTYNGHTEIKNRPTATRRVQKDHLPKLSTRGQQTPESGLELNGGNTDATPKQVRQTIRAYVKSDSYDVDQEVLRLWNGGDEGRESPSEADMAFVKQLYYWCKGDQQLMDECFRTSGRMRSKWDKVHYSNGDTYGEQTISKVSRTNNDTFGGRYVQ